MSSPTIIIKWKRSRAKSRSKQEERLRGEGWGPTMNDEQLEKLRFVEKEVKEKIGVDPSFIATSELSKVK